MRKQLEDFLIDLSEIFPIASTKSFDKVIGMSVEYLLEFCAGKEFDFKKARHLIFDRYKFKNFPELSIVKDCILESEIKKYEHCENEGKLVVIKIPERNIIYSFEVNSSGRDIREIKNTIGKNLGKYEIEIYPKGTVLIGDKVFTP